jgi:hypothetical protein
MGLYKTNKTKFLNLFAETGQTSINRILAFNKDEVSIPILHTSGNYTGKIQIRSKQYL